VFTNPKKRIHAPKRVRGNDADTESPFVSSGSYGACSESNRWARLAYIGEAGIVVCVVTDGVSIGADWTPNVM
jgi:hypothetical protein